jgi:general secretion pathway protein G
MMSRRSFRSARRGSRAGFTLIELLLVLVILGVLAGLVIPKLVGKGEESRKGAAAVDISTIANALDRYEIEVGHYPSSEEGLDALMVAPANVQKWSGPYLSKPPIDPWGHPYQYRNPGTSNNRGYDIYSFGPDGRDGGEDDITNFGSPAK